MSISYDLFLEAFTSKVSTYDFYRFSYEDRDAIVDGYMHRALHQFSKVCVYKLTSSLDDDEREIAIDVPEDDLDEIIDIVSEGMVVQWLKPYIYKQELLENVLNTADYKSYSPAELLFRVRETYADARTEYKRKITNYSYDHGDLARLYI